MIKKLQPMETAPHDGTCILIKTTVFSRNLHLWIVGRLKNKVWRCPSSFHHIKNPVGWMPLPNITKKVS